MMPSQDGAIVRWFIWVCTVGKDGTGDSSTGVMNHVVDDGDTGRLRMMFFSRISETVYINGKVYYKCNHMLKMTVYTAK